ncbi:MAG: ABC transporter ATP-binding protein [Rhodobacteraceae bacterium]|nr:ABC transporter ATP-binding protein [Paracoccaceae bacterium]
MSFFQNIEDMIDHTAHADGPPPGTVVPFIRWSLKGAGKAVGIGALISASSGVFEVFSAYMLGFVIDAAAGTEPGAFFGQNAWLLVGIVLFFLVARPLVLGLSGMSQTVLIAPGLLSLVTSRLHRYTLGQPVSFFDDDFAGRIAQKEGQAARAVTDLVVDLLHAIIFALASFVGAVVMLALVNVWTMAVLGLWIIVYLAFIAYFMPRIRVRSQARAAARAMVTGQIVDTVTNINTVKLFAHSQHEDQAALGALGILRQKSLDWGWLSAKFRFLLMALSGVLPLVVVGAALFFWSRGTASIGEVVGAGTIALRLSQMTGFVSFTLMNMYSNIGEVEDAIETLSPAYKLFDAPGAVEMQPASDIKFENITFTYGRGSGGGVRNLTLDIKAGEKLGIVGASGAGKSTLVSLLLRLHDPEEGQVLIGGQPVHKVTQESLRRQIGMVTQETAMFNRAAADNIRYGRPEASDEEVADAARSAEAHEFILNLEDFRGRKGYKAYLGERGVKLSGGQRQRISLARALLKDAPILVLDEATSALDSEVEAQIQKVLETAMQGKTVIAIAHRLSTLSSMDRIIVLDDGEIVEQGNHAQLLAHDGLYARYWNRQSGGFIQTDEAG